MEHPTCQICGREIKAKSGLIAHHGYRRPWHGSGCQTASCFGARRVPYEVGHDALDQLIPMVEDEVKRFTKLLADWLDNPPATITIEHGDFMGRKTGKVTVVERPENFACDDAHYKSYVPMTYENKWCGRRREIEQQLKWSEMDLASFKKRRAEWKEPK
jgi:hypothetical protein